jgi:HEAT repeat protein
LEALEGYLADAADLNAAAGAGLVRRRILATVLARVVPAAYRQQRRDAAALMKLRRFARHGLRPLLDLIGAPDADLDPRVVEVLGMLGRPEVVPELARMVAPDADAEDRNGVTRPISSMRDELAAGVVIALGRLGGEAARAALESLAEQSRSAPRLPILWALGRVGGPVAVRLAKLVIGCLTLGRAGGPEEGTLLEAIISDHSRAKLVRLGAVLGLGLGQHRASIELLAGLANAGDPELATAARVTLARLERGNEGGRRETKPEPAVDEAVAISGGHIDPESLLQVLLGDLHDVGGESTEATPVENSADAPHLAP